jgi:hypothetical protein
MISPELLLGEADRLLAGPAEAGCWPRACALLIRLALQGVLRRYWARVLPSAARVSMRAQLLLLPRYAGQDAARQASEAWHGLSRAAHHHAYELAPTAAELRGWLTLVTQLSQRLLRYRHDHT